MTVGIKAAAWDADDAAMPGGSALALSCVPSEGAVVNESLGGWRVPPLDRPPTPSAIQRSFPPGAFIAVAGCRIDAVYLVQQGLVQVCMPTARPGRENVVALLGPGDLLGVAGLVGRSGYHASGRAVTHVTAWSIALEDLRRRLPVDAGLQAAVLRAVVRRLASSQQLLADQHLRPVGARVARTTAELAARGAPPVPRMVMAALVGARRETVCRQLAWGRGAPPAAPEAGGRPTPGGAGSPSMRPRRSEGRR